MGGISGGGGSSSSQSTQQAGSLSVIPALLGQLFGLDSRARGGALGFAKTKPGETFEFFGEDQQFDPRQFDPSAFFSEQLTDEGQMFDINKAVERLNSAVDVGLGQIEDGGLSQMKEEFQTIFRENIIPETQARLGAMGLGGNDSDTRAALAREGSLAAANMANLAAQRQGAAAMAAPGLINALPGAEQSLRATARNRLGGVQSLNQLFGLAGINTQGQGTGRSNATSKQGQGGVSIGA